MTLQGARAELANKSAQLLQEAEWRATSRRRAMEAEAVARRVEPPRAPVRLSNMTPLFYRLNDLREKEHNEVSASAKRITEEQVRWPFRLISARS